jgi:putative ABC transport system permease protein
MAMWQRIAELFRRGKLDRELDDEMNFHLAMMESEFRAKGMSEEEARAAARREFGGVAHAKESYRQERGIPRLENLVRDARYALRGLRRNPGFAAAAVLSLALGIGANTAVFSIFHAVMMRSLPVSHPDELVMLYRSGGWGFYGVTSYPLYKDLRGRSDLFRGVVATSGTRNVRFSAPPGGRMQFVQQEFVSGEYFSVLGVQPALGRLFTADDNRTPHAHPWAVLGYDFWRSRLGADSQVLGRTLMVDEQPLTVIGVAAPGFRGVQVETHADLWTPIMMSRDNVMQAGMHWLYLLARPVPGISRARLQSAVDAAMQQYLESHYGKNPNAAFRRMSMEQRLEVRPAGVGVSMLRDMFGKPLTILMAAVGLVLLAACANVANLLLARGASRRREVAMRFSLGATRARLIGQAVTECLLLAVGGCVLGIGLAYWGTQQILRFLPVAPTQGLDAAPDGTVLAFTLAISILAVLLFGLAPAWRSTAIHPALALRAGADTGWVAGRQRFRRALVVAQVAFSVVLAVLAGLFARSLAQLRGVDLGFRDRNVVAFTLNFPSSWKLDGRTAAQQHMISQLESLPGVTSVSYGFPGPFQMGMSSWTVRVPGSPRASQEPVTVAVHTVGARYLETIGSTPLLGRDIDRQDTADSPNVAVVNQAFVREFLSNDPHPLGRVLSFDEESTRIVGVVRDIPHQGLRKKIAPTVYVPAGQRKSMGGNPTILVRSQLQTAALLPALRREMEKLGTDVAMDEPKTLAGAVDESIFQDRILATLGGCFGGLALLLAAIGLYGVIAFGTAQRAGEFGVRLALGAQRGDVLWIVLRDALLLVTAGLAVGLPASVFASRYVGSVLFDVKPGDTASFAGTAVVLVAVGVAAAFVPAHRSAGMDPMRALRHE